MDHPSTAPHPRAHGVSANDLTDASVDCQPWCHEGDGHGDDWFRADRACWGSDRQYLSGEPTGTQAFGSGQQTFVVSLEPQAHATEPRVLISSNEDNDNTDQGLTLHEARRFALEVLALVDGHKV